MRSLLLTIPIPNSTFHVKFLQTPIIAFFENLSSKINTRKITFKLENYYFGWTIFNYIIPLYVDNFCPPKAQESEYFLFKNDPFLKNVDNLAMI